MGVGARSDFLVLNISTACSTVIGAFGAGVCCASNEASMSCLNRSPPAHVRDLVFAGQLSALPPAHPLPAVAPLVGFLTGVGAILGMADKNVDNGPLGWNWDGQGSGR